MIPARLSLLALFLLAPLPAFARAGDFELVKLAGGVYAAVRTEPPGLTVNGNSVFIINDEDVVVVDTTLTPGTAREEIAALRRLTDKPVRYVVNTHWHDDHVMGNAAYREAFPGAEFVAHAATREYLPTTGLTNRRLAMSEGGYPGFIRALKARLEKNESARGGPLDEEERATLTSDIRIAERYMAENPAAPVVLPTLTLRERLTLHRGARVIDILHLGRGHTGGDVVVHLPAEGILVTGDLVVHPVPYVGNPQSHPAEWGDTLERLLALRHTVIVPGHGPVLRDDAHVRLMRRLFASLSRQVAAAAARGETLEQARRGVNLEEFRKLFAGDSRVRAAVFDVYVNGAGVAAAYADATAK
ncbi:MAG TPA: MBL fold metallo-hydrolase [Pyrinomonadaceae bacterium]|jgi:glyoxylase-like metal-dependent hydrolase (beta-lactamase superfamily II)